MYQILILLFIFQILVFIILLYKDIVKYKIDFLLLKKRLFDYYKQSDILIHGVSCGEIQLLKSIVSIIEQKNISYSITSHTPTGYLLGKKFTKNIYLKPYESFLTSFYLFYKVKPKKLIISESDSWPTYLIISKLFGIEIMYINYKIKYNKPIRNLYHNIFANKIFLKIEQIKPWYLINKYKFLGNIKFLNHQLTEKKLLKNSIIFASAHIEEIAIHIKMFLQLEDYVLIYVPRNLNCKDETINKLSKFNINWCEDIDDINITKNKKIINIFWKFGILNKLYNITQITIMGGTFDNTGGHNIIEPIVNRNIVLVGNSLYTIMDLLDIFKVFQIKEDNVKDVLLNIDKSVINDNIDIYNKYYKNVKNNLNQLML